MNADLLARFENWFDRYVADFYGIDEAIDVNVELKQVHTRRTCLEAAHIATHIGMADNDRLLAATIALFHDLGRFEQFRDFRTFKDPISFNHGLHSVTVLERENILAPLPPHERDLICTAISHHNMRTLPPDLNGSQLLHARLIRDADKIDIYRVVIEYRKRMDREGDAFKADLNFPISDDFSTNVLEALENGRTVDYQDLRTTTDIALLQLAWVYDVNFPASLERIKQLGHLAEIASWLPHQNPRIQAAAERALARLNNGSTS